MISKLIVNKFQGKITFNSEFNKGTTFTFTFELFDLAEPEKSNFDNSIEKVKEETSSFPFNQGLNINFEPEKKCNIS